MVTASERKMFFDVWPADDMTGAALGELTEATQKQFRAVDNMPGAGQFTINRNSDEFVMCATDNLIRVRLVPGGPLDFDSSDYIGAFFIEEGQDTIVSTDEEGGEYVTLTGRTIEMYLERAILDWEAHYVDDIVNHPYDKTALTDGQWHFSGDIPHASGNAGSPGGVLRIVVRNALAMTPPGIELTGLNFNINLDSNGDSWEDTDGRFDFDVGTDYLTILSRLVEGGLWYKAHPDFTISAWDNSQGTDLSASVTFEKGVNIRESGQREIHATRAKSRVLVKGSTKKGPLKYRWTNESTSGASNEDVSAGAIEDVIGVRQGFVDYPYSPTNARLAKAGKRFITQEKNRHDGPPTVGVLDYDGCEAFTDYQVGDTVGIILPGVDTTGVVHAITMVDNEAGNVDPVLEFIDEQWAGDSATMTTAVPASDPVGGASYGTSAAPSTSPEITLDDTEVCLIWAGPNSDLSLTGDGTLVASSDTNLSFAYVNGPAVFTLSDATTNTAFQWIVVSGSGSNATGA